MFFWHFGFFWHFWLFTLGRGTRNFFFLMCLTFWIFLTFLTFHFGAGNQAPEALGNPGGAVPPGNPGRGQAASADRLLCYPVRTPLGKPNWGKKRDCSPNVILNCSNQRKYEKVMQKGLQWGTRNPSKITENQFWSRLSGPLHPMITKIMKKWCPKTQNAWKMVSQDLEKSINLWSN